MSKKEKRGIGFTGASGSGKSTLAKLLIRVLFLLGVYMDEETALAMLDWFYRCLSHLTPEERKATNFDEPAALEEKLIALMLQTVIVDGRDFLAPGYRFSDQTRLPNQNPIYASATLLVFDGIFLLVWQEVVRHLDISIAVVADHDVRLQRRIERDKATRGIDEATTRTMWDKFVEPGNSLYIQPHIHKADLVVQNNNGQLEEALRRCVDLVLERFKIDIPSERVSAVVKEVVVDHEKNMIF